MIGTRQPAAAGGTSPQVVVHVEQANDAAAELDSKIEEDLPESSEERTCCSAGSMLSA